MKLCDYIGFSAALIGMTIWDILPISGTLLIMVGGYYIYKCARREGYWQGIFPEEKKRRGDNKK